MSTFQEELKSLRSQINDVDDELLKILARRVEISTAIGRLKHANGLAIVDAIRETEMIAERATTGALLNLPEAWITDLFRTILDGCVEISQQRFDFATE